MAESLTALVSAEIGYYERRVGERRFWANSTRLGAYLFGTLGLLIPLLAPISVGGYQADPHLGYVFLASAAAALIGNRLFGATQGHIRFIVTMYRLEARLTEFGLQWAQTRASADFNMSSSFQLLERLRADTYKILQEETSMWAQDVRSQEDSFAARLGGKGDGAAAERLGEVKIHAG